MKQKSIRKNMVLSALLTAANFLYPLITYSYVARVLGPAGTGRVAFVYSVLSYFNYFAVLGISVYGLREAAKVRDDRLALSHLVQELLLINLILTAASYVALALAVAFVPRLFEERALFMVMCGWILLDTIGVEWVYKALEEYGYITWRSLAFKTVTVILTFVLIRSDRDVLWYGFLHVFAMSASYFMNFLHVRKHISFRKTAPYDLKKHLQPILTFFSAAVVTTVYSAFDVTMLGFLRTEGEVGLYNAAVKIKGLVLSLFTGVTAVTVPRMAYYLRDGDSEQADRLIVKSLRVSLCLALPIAVYIFLFGADCLEFLCGREYLEAVTTLRILVACIVPLILSNLFGHHILIPLGKEKRYSQSVFVGMWINLGLNALLIPGYGAPGAAAATLVTEIWNTVWMGWWAGEYRTRMLKGIRYANYLIPLALAVLAGLGMSKLVPGSLFGRLVLTGLAFFAVFYGTLALGREPLVMELQTEFLKRLKGTGAEEEPKTETSGMTDDEEKRE